MIKQQQNQIYQIKVFGFIFQGYRYDIINLQFPVTSKLSFCAGIKILSPLINFVTKSPFEISPCPSITITERNELSVTSICAVSSTASSSTVKYSHLARMFPILL